MGDSGGDSAYSFKSCQETPEVDHDMTCFSQLYIEGLLLDIDRRTGSLNITDLEISEIIYQGSGV